MKEEIKELTINNQKVKVVLLVLEEKDRKSLKELYESWYFLNKGMKTFKSRGINMPEGISEGAFCLCFNTDCARVVEVKGGPASFDALDLKTLKMIQIKATSVKNDLTSFGPKSVWDDLYFLDFYREGKFDGSFDVYKIPNNLIYNHKVNANQTFKEQQAQSRRPRMRIKQEIISVNGLKPIKTCKI